jgi:hypothetical protein
MPQRGWLCVAAAVLAAGHECVHDALQRQLHRIVPHQQRHLASATQQTYNVSHAAAGGGRRLQAGAAYAPIRITVDTSSLEAGA